MKLPGVYLLLRQYPGQPCQVIYTAGNPPVERVLFSGGRWAARRRMAEIQRDPAMRGIPAFCQKRRPRGALRGIPPVFVQLPEPLEIQLGLG